MNLNEIITGHVEERFLSPHTVTPLAWRDVENVYDPVLLGDLKYVGDCAH